MRHLNRQSYDHNDFCAFLLVVPMAYNRIEILCNRVTNWRDSKTSNEAGWAEWKKDFRRKFGCLLTTDGSCEVFGERGSA